MDSTLSQAVEWLRSGQAARAEPLLRQAVSTDPDRFDAIHLLGVCMHSVGRFEEAERLIERALRIDPRSAAAHVNLGNALRAQNRRDEALNSFSRACNLDPALAVAQANRGLLLLELQRPAEAIESLRRASSLGLDRPDINLSLGMSLLDLHLPDQALPHLQAYAQAQPSDALAWIRIGVAFNRLRQFADASDSFARAIELAPGLDIAHANLGNALYHLGQFAEAESSYRRALEFDPSNGLTRWNLGLCRLLRGDLPGAWGDYEARWLQRESPNFSPREFFDKPAWRGEPKLRGSTLLLHSEQGLGDTLQFCRYVPWVAQLGARTILEVQPSLHRLLERAFEPSTVVVPRGERLPAFDLHCPLMSLPFAFQTTLRTIPARVPYLSADPARVQLWRERLGRRVRPRVGLVWSGGPEHTAFHAQRSVPLQELLPLDDGRVELLALQVEVRDSDRAALPRFANLRWVGDQIRDFDDTAALICLCDLVVSVDTSVAHLAGALGNPVRILLAFAADWRWMLDRQDSPWYPNARLVRQKARLEWGEVVQAIRAELEALSA
jgi:Tfp pilus assembly protein PilF